MHSLIYSGLGSLECFVITKWTKFVELIITKIIKIVATTCQILSLKCQKKETGTAVHVHCSRLSDGASEYSERLRVARRAVACVRRAVAEMDRAEEGNCLMLNVAVVNFASLMGVCCELKF